MKFRSTLWGQGIAILLLSLTFVPGCSEQKEGNERTGFKTESDSRQSSGSMCSTGNIAIIDMYISPTDKGGTGGLYCRLNNSGEEVDSLIGATTAITQITEIHEMVDDGGMMTMRQLKGGFPIRARGSAELKLGGPHIMLINVERQLKKGDTLEVELRFARAGALKCKAIVGNEPPAKGAAATGEGMKGEGGDQQMGAQVYKAYCQSCHQADGKGTGSIFPPLAGSEYLKKKEQSIDAVVNGKQGPLVVNGTEYNGVMPPLPALYDNEQAAAVLNYVVKTFGDGSWSTTAAEVGKIRKK